MADGNFPLRVSEGREVDMDFVSEGPVDVLHQDLGSDLSSLCLCDSSEEKTGGAEGSSLSSGEFREQYDDIKFGSASVGAEGNSSKEELCLGLSGEDYSSDFSVITSSVGFGEDDYCWMSLGDDSRCDNRGFDKNGVHAETGLLYDGNGLDKDGLDVEGFDSRGFDKNGFNRNGFDSSGYDRRGFDINGIHKNGSPYNEHNRDRDGYVKCDYLLMFKDRSYNN
ncbi:MULTISPECIES: hypothetical protein [Candidatus Ichthyocystis]|uniref:Uncharacterized protein n=1 Tax=Candidatus Ichthyocystis hellenicum TaxID=1561003 RepID=A0A0S4M2B7_9BURK|nr:MULTISPECIES: hypothetical protein [Ichthyocystis]CUT17927.1 hypothetical protein Ark11_1114 [Candidatus Ichthyocystis hellenicum]